MDSNAKVVCSAVNRVIFKAANRIYSVLLTYKFRCSPAKITLLIKRIYSYFFLRGMEKIGGIFENCHGISFA
ncbi:Hypothetical predicted protein [Cloeon dipterum]|uniref:Uncharacterized protein n=1 Tax=Cloeon dipterum TaxID=197152 RepID=A0A8S1E1I9_9INSE|nr:Hypothetical predicted protein [Cloeon dipterum]